MTRQETIDRLIQVKVLKDSISTAGKRLTTFELKYPRSIHAQLMTHRDFSRNAGSSRAIPTKKLISSVYDDMVEPIWWGKNQSGMQAYSEMEPDEIEQAREIWNGIRDFVADGAERLATLGMHKQSVNRILEPFQCITIVVTATNFTNWYGLRADPEAQAEIDTLAVKMALAHAKSEPTFVDPGEWHLPLVSSCPSDPLYVDPSEISPEDLVKISVARCARVSYLTHDGIRDLAKDLELYERLLQSGHWSPFEHQAMALEVRERYGNLVGWKQYRKFFAHEYRE